MIVHGIFFSAFFNFPNGLVHIVDAKNIECRFKRMSSFA